MVVEAEEAVENENQGTGTYILVAVFRAVTVQGEMGKMGKGKREKGKGARMGYYIGLYNTRKNEMR